MSDRGLSIIQRVNTDFVCILASIGVVLFFWIRLFIPLQLLVTPDFGISDAWHYNIATRYVLWQSYQNNSLPLWVSSMGQGFPLFAEGQSGALFIPNYIFFKAIPNFPLAFNSVLLSTFIIFTVGMYTLFRRLSHPPLLSMFGAVTVSFSGFVIPQATHISLLQGFSLMPWIVLCLLILYERPNFLKISVLSFLLSQQVFAGYPQTVLITLAICGVIVVYVSKSFIQILRNSFLFLFVLTCMLLFSAAQIVPSLEFMRVSNVAGGFPLDKAMEFSFTPKHFITIVFPYYFGSPKNATYPAFNNFDGNIFWETNIFLGLLSIIGIFALTITPKLYLRQREFIMSAFGAIVGFLLMSGKHSPLFLIYSFWPFNLFRVPARFNWMFGIFFVLGILFLLKNIFSIRFERRQKFTFRGVLIIVCFVSVLYQIVTWWDYHLLVPSNEWLLPPNIQKYIKASDTIFSYGFDSIHNTYFLGSDWGRSENVYYDLRNGLRSNEYLLWDVRGFDLYVGRYLRRQEYLRSFINANITYSEIDNRYEISGAAISLLKMFGVNKIVTPIGLMNKDLKLMTRFDSPSRLSFYVYELDGVHDSIYTSTDLITAQTLEDVARTFQKGENSIVVEENVPVNPVADQSVTQILTIRDQYMSVRVTNTSSTLLVRNATYYPGWEARINGRSEKIIPVNITSQGVVVPPGTHTIEFIYRNQSFITGLYISVVSLFLALFINSLILFSRYIFPANKAV